MKRLFKTALCSSVALAAMAASVPVIAQEITSSIRGTVVSSSGSTIANAEVTVTHADSGSRSTFTTNAQGVFFARGLRPGGPYTVSVAASGNYQTQTIDGLFLTVSQPLPLTIPVAALGASVEEIEITARRIEILRSGGSSAYGSDTINDMPSVARDFKDTIRANPFVTLRGDDSSLSIGGANNRFNSITLDGIGQDDSFGLNPSGVPTQRSPISIDIIEQVSVAPAPFGVEFGGFTGGQLNVVTKSGTNEFHGSALFQYRDAGLAGDKSKDDDIDLGQFENKFYSATLGGPIIKDKLFFFAAYEKFKGTSPNTFGAEDSGASNPVTGVTTADLDRITEIAQRVYGYDTQGTDAGSVPESDEKIFFKVDWNINDNHRAFASFQRTSGNELQIQDTSTSQRRFGFLGHWYNRTEKVTSYNGQIFSDWSDNFSTELKVGYTEQETTQASLSPSNFGEAQITTAGGGRVYLGTDDSRHANRLSNETLNIKFKADYVINEHTLTAGYELNSVDVFNVFVQEALGEWRFNSIDDFENQAADRFQYQNAVTNNSDDAAANFNISKHTLYLQDRWDVSDKLTVTGGVRVDLYKQGKSPALNQNFVDRNGFENTGTLDGKSLVQPRFSFTYDFDEKTTVRGGFGLFGGGDPNVWIANSFSLDGVTVAVFDTRRGRSSENLDVLDNADIDGVPQIAQDALAAGNGNVAATDLDFKIPSVWKLNIAVDRYFDFGPLGKDWLLTAEAIFSRTKQAADWKELRRTVVGTAVDGTPIYSSFNGGTDLLLTNTDEGKSDLFAFSFDKSWDNGVSLFGSYTYQDVNVVNEGTSSTAGSNFRFAAYADINNRQLGTSAFEIKHEIKLGLTYKQDFWNDNTTTVSLFYNGRSGRPYSSGYSSFGGIPFGGDFDFDNSNSHLVYVPTVDETGLVGSDGNAPAGVNVAFADQATLDAFNAFVEENGLTRGQIVDKYDRKEAWLNQLDLHVAQEVPVGFGKVELFFDMENVLNFISSGAGRNERADFQQFGIVNLDIDANNKFIYSNFTDPQFELDAAESVWRVQIGARYRF